MLRAINLDRAELSILVCDDETIRDLNRRYRRKNKPTDVLAFPLQSNSHLWRGTEALGDVVISFDTAKRQAPAHQKTVDDEMIFLLAHGLLHLLGLDHRTSAEDRRMKARTDALVAAARSN